MRRIPTLLIFGFLLPFFACSNDDDNEPNEPQIEEGLFYDGPNANSPVLPAGEYEAAVRFPSSETTPFSGREITSVFLYFYNLPTGVQVKIYRGNGPDAPSTLLYSDNITRNELAEFAWSEHVLDTPLEITGDEIWVSTRFVHPFDQQSIGCDAGPRNSQGGDYLFEADNSAWTTYQALTNGESINWNIRVRVE